MNCQGWRVQRLQKHSRRGQSRRCIRRRARRKDIAFRASRKFKWIKRWAIVAWTGRINNRLMRHAGVVKRKLRWIGDPMESSSKHRVKIITGKIIERTRRGTEQSTTCRKKKNVFPSRSLANEVRIWAGAGAVAQKGWMPAARLTALAEICGNCNGKMHHTEEAGCE